MSSLRVFIAIELPPSLQNSIDKQTARLRQTLGDQIIRWVPPQNLHLTLKFIGDVSTSHLEFLKQLAAQEGSSHRPFELQIGGLGAFPNANRPRILWAGLHAPPDLVALQMSVEMGASRLGYEREEREFAPHLTLGRVRQNVSSPETQKIKAALDAIQLGSISTTRVDSIHLFKSDLHPSGPIYTRLFSAPLSKP